MTHLYFFGGDQYSAVVLRSLLQNWDTAKLQNLTVITDPKTPPNPVESLARKHSLPVTYYTLALIVLPDTIGLTASFPHLFPSELIKTFNGQLYNLHPSLLPQYRNVAPVPYAIALGDQVTGITLFRIAPNIDNGEIISQVEEPILPTDDTPTLLTRLFTKGTQLFLNWITDKLTIRPADSPISRSADQLIFTRRLTRQSGFVEWNLIQKLLNNNPISISDTQNELLRLRLGRTQGSAPTNILNDLIRALTGYEKVWTIAPTRKGDLPISLSIIPNTKYIIQVLVPGKPRLIPYSDFTKYYLND